MEIIQIIIILFALFAFSRAALRARDRKIKQNEFIFWSIIWIAIIIVAFIPGITGIFAKPFGIGRGADFAVYISLIALFYLMFRLYVKAEKIEKDITKLVREIALKLK